jgi:uncharacterized membrane protein
MEETSSTQKNIGMAIVANILFFIPLLTDAKNDPFVKYHVKQGLVLFIGWIVTAIVGYIPVIGWILAPLMSLALLILLIIGIMNAAKGEQKELPFIGQYAEKFKF